MIPIRHLVPPLAAVVFTTALAFGPAHADNSEIMDSADTGWQNQAPQGNWANQQPQQGQFQQAPRQGRANQAQPQNGRNLPQFAAPPAGFQCPAGWSCAPKVVEQKKEKPACKSRFSRCYRNKMGYGGGGGGDD